MHIFAVLLSARSPEFRRYRVKASNIALNNDNIVNPKCSSYEKKFFNLLISVRFFEL